MIFGVMTTESGTCFAFPDACLTPAPPGPPVPIPYPNTGQCAQGSGASKVTIRNKAPMRKGDQIRMTSGDEPGVAGGVMSGQIKGPAEIKLGCPKVKIEGKEAGRHTSMVGHNGMSANMPAGLNVAPSQTKVRVMP